jgi:hypothetical protein
MFHRMGFLVRESREPAFQLRLLVGRDLIVSGGGAVDIRRPHELVQLALPDGTGNCDGRVCV